MNRIAHNAAVYGTPLAGVFATDIESRKHFGRHAHDGFGFGFLVQGAQRWWSGRGTVRGYPGDIISTNPGEVHDGSPMGGPSRRWRIIHVDAGAMDALTGRRAGVIARPVIRDHALLQLVAVAIERLIQGAAPLATEEALVESTALLMSRHGSDPRPEPPAAADMAPVRERLADASLPAPSLAELSTITSLSRYQVLRRFRAVHGVTPHAWLGQLKVERARSQIRRGSTLSSSAFAAGFADQSHMNRAFMRHYGFTPGQYRDAVVK